MNETKDLMAVATVVRVSGSAPRPVGSKLFMMKGGGMEGSVSGGCVENDVIIRAAEVRRDGSPVLVEYGISDDDAFAVGLACGGVIQVLIEPEWIPAPEPGARATVVEGVGKGAWVTIDAGGGPVGGSMPDSLVDRVAGDAAVLIGREESATVDYAEASVYFDVRVPPPHLFIFGATDIGQALCRHAKHLGYQVTVSDARPAFADPARFPEADEVLVGWPGSLDLQFDDRSFVVVLSHDSRFEDPIWPIALASPAPYIGAMGSKKTAADRRRRLADSGLGGSERIHGPIGLDIGSRTAEEVAIAILAEMTMARYGRGGELHGRVRRLERDV